MKPQQASTSSVATLKGSYEGWKKAASRPKNTLPEFSYAIDRFCELHGDMAVVRITRGHVLQFRQALQEMPCAGPSLPRKSIGGQPVRGDGAAHNRSLAGSSSCQLHHAVLRNFRFPPPSE